ncbi:MAG TPA: hypothetical protein VK105_00375 [Virgibacillus sp.]|nr:hypothetical protein [Virgibacillus sp.]HLR65578.1 hypothetical protein [Virgibacillus sp.]
MFVKKYIPFYFDKHIGRLMFYDMLEKQFYTNLNRKEKPILAALLCIMFLIWLIYAIVPFTSGTLEGNGFFVIFASILYSLFFSIMMFAATIVIELSTTESVEKVDTPEKQVLLLWIEAGKKSSNSIMLRMLGLFGIIIFFMLLLLLFPASSLLFIIHSMLWTVFVVKIRFERPIERRYIYTMMKLEIKHDKEVYFLKDK